MQMRIVALATALAALATTAATAQRQPAARPAQPTPPGAQAPATPQDQPQAPMQAGPMRGGLAVFLSTNPTALNLTADQLRRIQAVHDRAVQANAALRQQIQTATANSDLSTLGLVERHALMVRVRGLREQMLDNIDSATTVALATLNTEQQRTLLAMHQMRAGMGRGMGMRGGAMGGPGVRGRMMRARGMRRGVGMGGMMQGGMMQGGPMQGRMGPGMMMQGGMMPAMAPAAGAQPGQRPPQ
jgi:hypothetical protein